MIVDLAFKTLVERHKRKEFPDIVDAFLDAAFIYGVSYNLKIDDELRNELAVIITEYKDQIRRMINKEG